MQYFFIKFFITIHIIAFQCNLLIREEHEVINQNLCSFFQRFLRMNRTVGSNLKYQFVVVRLLFNTERFNLILHITYRCINGIDRNYVNIRAIFAVFITRQKATTLLLGPGLGYTAQSAARAAETRELVEKLLPGFGGSAVLDADGLNAAASLLNAGRALPHPAGELILTPHPGEMSRLTGRSTSVLAADREGAACRLAREWNAVVVLKGAGTVVAAPDGRCCVNTTGNPGLSRGGSGDALAGMTAALLACGLPAYEAAACAVYLHGAAADRAAALRGEYGMLPQDLFAQLGRLFAEHHR